ncbi:hypothetical protein [Ferrovibrio sp.]|uniref:hypothetical protein n=1 Tax=Ferrovibrio sp. TaxID=1917215 RepID=UPI0025C4CF7C|nr:hypothetical protein [Ferrovibrio sp.]MBX3454448.1 hypothetical protein [Ferrovibrio sp.]
MENKKNPAKMNWKQWAACYIGSLSLGGLVWYGTNNTWLGFGAILAFTAFFVFYISGRNIKAERAAQQPDPANMTRQQRRDLERKNNKK